jgi:hypothetical protein
MATVRPSEVGQTLAPSSIRTWSLHLLLHETFTKIENNNMETARNIFVCWMFVKFTLLAWYINTCANVYVLCRHTLMILRLYNLFIVAGVRVLIWHTLLIAWTVCHRKRRFGARMFVSVRKWYSSYIYICSLRALIFRNTKMLWVLACYRRSQILERYHVCEG